jgi:arylsulfatase A-like enzyme
MNSEPTVLGRTVAESTLRTIERPRSLKKSPNVIVIVLDDVGFAQLGCFGSDISTPSFDRLAEEGLRYNRFHVTSLCSPTRASLLTGRNHHAVGMGFVPDVPLRLPGYTGRIPPSAVTVARHLRDAGYSTMAVGKWHLTPRYDRTASGPFGLWPLGQGFERFYGFLHADTNQWTPNLVSDNHFVEPPKRPEDGYHLTEDLVDIGIRQLRAQQNATPEKPFFLYLATGAQHAPHQVPPEWIEPYRGRFDSGWEEWRQDTFERQRKSGIVPETTTCTARPTWVQDWKALPDEERRLYARMQEIFAAFLSHTDHQIGRLLGALDELGLSEDTLVIALSDNGASAEGGPIGSVNEGRFTLGLDNLADNLAHIDELGGFRLYNHYPWGWAWAGNTPFRLWKRYAWLGGTRVPLIVRWPAEIEAKGEIRGQFCHAVDVTPTILDVCGVTPATEVDGVTQQGLDGASLRPTFKQPNGPPPRNIQYFEMLGSRSIYVDGWKATTDRVLRGVAAEEQRIPGSRELVDDKWLLFDLDEDFSEERDLADENPDVVRQLVDLWFAEAGRCAVLPMGDWLDRRSPDLHAAIAPPPTPMFDRKVFRPGGGPIADEVIPPMTFGGQVVFDLQVPEQDARGVLAAHGNWTGGWVLFVERGHLTLVLNSLGHEHRLRAPDPMLAGFRQVTFCFAPGLEGATSLELSVDSQAVASVALPADVVLGPGQADGNGLRLGYDAGFPVCDDYEPPFPWTGEIHRVTFEPRGFKPIDDQAAADDAVHRD